MVTAADLIAAREAVSMIPKHAAFYGDPAKAAERDALYKKLTTEYTSPEYWRAKAAKEFEGLQGDELAAKQAQFAKQNAKAITDSISEYGALSDAAATGGMVDRYSGVAGGLGAAIGALLGGVFGGKGGAVVGALLGGIGLYAAQKLGLGGDSLQNFFKESVDTVMGPTASPVDKQAMFKAVDSATAAAAVQAAPIAPTVTADAPAADLAGNPPAMAAPESTADAADAAAVDAALIAGASSDDAPAAKGILPAFDKEDKINEAVRRAAARRSQVPQQLREAAKQQKLDQAQAQLQALKARREAAAADLARSKTGAGQLAGKIKPVVTTAKEIAKVPGQVLGDAAEAAKTAGGAYVAGVDAVGSQATAAAKQGLAKAKELGEFGKHVISAGKHEATKVGEGAKKWLGERGRDVRTILDAFK